MMTNHRNQLGNLSQFSVTKILSVSFILLALLLLTKLVPAEQQTIRQQRQAPTIETQKWRKFSSGAEYMKFKMDVLKVVQPLIDDLKKMIKRSQKKCSQLKKDYSSMQAKLKSLKREELRLLNRQKTLEMVFAKCSDKKK